MSHSTKITDIDPRSSEEELKDMVQSAEFEMSNSGESAPAEDISLRGTSEEEAEGDSGDAGEAVPDALEEKTEPTEEGKAEATEAPEADAETAEALRTLHAIETVLKGGASSKDGGKSFEREIPSVLPVLPLRDLVVYNSMIIPLFENREKGMETVERALNGSRYLLLCAQLTHSILGSILTGTGALLTNIIH